MTVAVVGKLFMVHGMMHNVVILPMLVRRNKYANRASMI